MATKEQKEKQTAESITSIVAPVVLATEGVASMQPVPAVPSGILITSIFGNMDIDVFVNVFYGCNIPEVSWNIQERIKEALEANSVKADHINIHIEGVDLGNVKNE